MLNAKQKCMSILLYSFTNDISYCITLASSKVSLNVFSDSPDMPDTIEGADILMNGTSASYIVFHHKLKLRKRYGLNTKSLLTPAIACANNVLPHPGGPCSKIPLTG